MRRCCCFVASVPSRLRLRCFVVVVVVASSVFRLCSACRSLFLLRVFDARCVGFVLVVFLLCFVLMRCVVPFVRSVRVSLFRSFDACRLSLSLFCCCSFVVDRFVVSRCVRVCFVAAVEFVSRSFTRSFVWRFVFRRSVFVVVCSIGLLLLSFCIPVLFSFVRFRVVVRLCLCRRFVLVVFRLFCYCVSFVRSLLVFLLSFV